MKIINLMALEEIKEPEVKETSTETPTEEVSKTKEPIAEVPVEEVSSIESKKAKTETELVIYCKIGYFEGLKEAVKKEQQDQYEIRSSQEISGNKGCVRVRKTTCSDGIKFVMTNKVRTINENLSISEEFDLEITEEQFIMFTKIAPSKTIKERFIFLTKNISLNKFGEETISIEVPELKFEVDVFPKEEGGYHEWCKIDVELDSLIKAITDSGHGVGEFNLNVKVNHLPFKPTESFVGVNATEEQNLILDNFYQNIFSVKM